jgi:hypothetical protein
MYSVMVIFKSSIVWGLFEYTECFIAPKGKKSGGEKSGELGGQMVLEVILSTNTSSENATDQLHYLVQSGCLAADWQGQGDTRLTLTPSVIYNSKYVIMVSD